MVGEFDDVRHTYIIFFHPKRQLLFFRGGKVATQWKLLTEDYVMGVTYIMNSS